MSLKNLKNPKHEIETPNGNFSVRGLTSPDIVRLLKRFDSTIMDLANSSQSGSIQVAELTRELLAKAPDFAGAIIALAADEPDAEEQAANLPFGTQFAVLDKISELTFEMDGGVENFLTRLSLMLAAAKKLNPTTNM